MVQKKSKFSRQSCWTNFLLISLFVFVWHKLLEYARNGLPGATASCRVMICNILTHNSKEVRGWLGTRSQVQPITSCNRNMPFEMWRTFLCLQGGSTVATAFDRKTLCTAGSDTGIAYVWKNTWRVFKNLICIKLFCKIPSLELSSVQICQWRFLSAIQSL